MMSRVFLKAEWRKLVLANYSVDKSLLKKYLPYRTELDAWNGTDYVSLVGFMFLNTQVKGFKIPMHVNFEEVNLRFYVRHKAQDGWRRGVVFIKEIVPKMALAWVANTVYGEHYESMKMSHTWEHSERSLKVAYRWKKKEWHGLSVDRKSVV